MGTLHLDTHVVAHLYSDPSRISTRGQSAIDRAERLTMSPAVLVELGYLHEIGRIRQEPKVLYQYLADTIGLSLAAQTFSQVALAALEQSWTRDPFDRLIVAQAAIQGHPLLTRHRRIREHYGPAFW